MARGCPKNRRHLLASFTLVELITAIAVLSILLVFVSIIFTAASKATLLSRERLDADRQARLVFDSLADDFTRMVRRSDIDFHFVKGSVTASPGANDSFFFYCENPGYFGSSLTATMESNLALVGYRINTINNPPTDTQYTLEKLAKGLAWDVQFTTNYPVAFLTMDNAPSNFTPNANSTIVGRYPGPPIIDQPTYTDSNFHLLGDSTFRLEFCFLLTDGTYSLVPAINYSFTPPSGTATTSNLSASAAPTSSNGYPTYGVGSRWYDTTNSRGYICTSAPSSSSSLAVWQPLGMTDVRAVIVAIAILDQTSQKLIAANATALSSLSSALNNPTAANLATSPPVLMATTWQNAVNSSTFASTVGIPSAVAAQVRIYQRFFYLNNQ